MPSYSESYSKTFSSVNGNVLEDKEIKKINDNNIKLHIFERDKDLVTEKEIPLHNNLFKNQKNMVQNLILNNTMHNLKKLRDSISLQKERNQNMKKCGKNSINFRIPLRTVDKYHPLPYIPTGRLTSVLNKKERIRRLEIRLQRNKFDKNNLMKKNNKEKKKLEIIRKILIKQLEEEKRIKHCNEPEWGYTWTGKNRKCICNDNEIKEVIKKGSRSEGWICEKKTKKKKTKKKKIPKKKAVKKATKKAAKKATKKATKKAAKKAAKKATKKAEKKKNQK